MTEKIELPPLPEPALILPEAVPSSGAFMMWKPSHRFTAEQMRSYASEAVRMAVEAERERCARLAEELIAFDMDDPGSTVAAHIRIGAEPGQYIDDHRERAAAIRQNKPESSVPLTQEQFDGLCAIASGSYCVPKKEE